VTADRLAGRREYDRIQTPPRLRVEAGRPERPIRSAALTGLFVLALLYTLRAAREFLLPLAIGLMAYFLLVPLVRAVRRRVGIPEPIGAAVVLVGLGLVVGLGLYGLSYPAAAWVARAPQSIRQVESRLRPVFQRVERVTRTAEQMERLTAGQPARDPNTPQIQVREPGLGAAFLGGMQSLLGGAIIVLSLVYFLLASGDAFLQKLVRGFPGLQERQSAVDIVREMERQISSYLFLTTVVNTLFGFAIGVLMWAMGMPNAVLWGVLAGVTNFVPYLGGVVCTVVLGLAALLTFDHVGYALAVPLAFFLVNTLESYVVTPMVMGRRFTLDPAVLFVALLFWWYVWGIVGALVAVPMMAAFKIFCERVEGLQGIAAFLGDEPPAEPEPQAREAVAGTT
jgi:predicted PurR-regulated permease PerM